MNNQFLVLLLGYSLNQHVVLVSKNSDTRNAYITICKKIPDDDHISELQKLEKTGASIEAFLHELSDEDAIVAMIVKAIVERSNVADEL
ncbi:MAG: hypothetical protein NUV54_02510 [Candidatus Taylorbacteria bacterium]|nr:hypothetical protein [Candidatus Taylorbacteria bacterium]